MRNGSCGSVYAANCRLVGFEDIKNGFMREGWEYKRLNEVCDKGSSNIVISKLTDNHGEYPLFGASGLVKNIDFYHQESPYIGIVKDGAGVGRVNIYPAYSSLVGTMQYIYPKEGHSLDYIKYFLVKLDLSHLVSGATIPHIYFKDYGKEIIPLPPKSVQLEIVSELDQINELIRLKKEQQKDYDKLAQSIFYEMFGDPVENDKGWEVKMIQDIGLVKTGPFGSMLHKEDYVSDGIPLVNPIHMKDYKVVADREFSVSIEKAIELDNYILRKDDVVFARRGDIGRCAVISEKEDGYLCGTGSLFVRFTMEISPLYIMYIIRSESFTKELISKAKGATMLNLNSTTIGKLNLPLPPLPLQQEFSSLISQIERQKAVVSNAIADLETLLASRMQYWFE